ncbi:MAG: hypothetical protein ACKVJG_14085 [Candidatus Latescibacterota bacterium]|jgi:hypothetical protein
MREISVEEAQAGDIVAAPVQDENGRVLLPAGAKLSPAVLSRLKGWGVVNLSIEGDEGDEGEMGKSTEDFLGELEHRFAGHEGDALMMRIKEVARQHLSQR